MPTITKETMRASGVVPEHHACSFRMHQGRAYPYWRSMGSIYGGKVDEQLRRARREK